MGLDFLEGGADFERALSKTGFGRFHYVLLAVCGLVYMDTAIGVTILSFVLPSATCDFNMSSSDKGLLTAAPMLGMLVGSYFWGCLADTQGRRGVLVAALLVDSIAGLASSVAQYFGIFVALRLICGFGLTGAMLICFPYLGEFQPTHLRERILSWMELFWVLGIIALPGLAWALIPVDMRVDKSHFVFDSWNLFVAVAALPSLILALWLLFFPESPKFLMESGFYDEALGVFRHMYHVNTGNPPETYPISNLKEKARHTSVWSMMSSKSGRSVKSGRSIRSVRELGILIGEIWNQTKALCRPPHLKNTALACFVQFGLTSSYYTLMVWFPELFNRFEIFETANPKERGSVCDVSQMEEDEADCNAAIDSSVFLHTLIIGLACIPTSFVLPVFMHRLGAKFFLVGSLAVAGGITLGFYFVGNSTENLVLSCIFEALTSLAISVVYAVLVDLFPTNLRVMAAALSLTFGRGGALIGNLVFGFLIELNCLVPIVLFAGLLFASALACFFLPSTGKTELD